MPAPDTLADLQAVAIRFRDARDWAQFHTPKDLALGLTVEKARGNASNYTEL